MDDALEIFMYSVANALDNTSLACQRVMSERRKMNSTSRTSLWFDGYWFTDASELYPGQWLVESSGLDAEVITITHHAATSDRRHTS